MIFGPSVLVVPAVWTVTDEALLAGFAVGDPDAAAEFVTRFKRRVYGIAIAINRDRRAAEDLAQEAFLRAWRHAETYDPRRGSVATWLMVIARNLAIDAMRARGVPEPLDPDEIVSMPQRDESTDPFEVAAHNSDVTWLRHALEELPDGQRRAVALAGVVGLTADEIAEREQIPLGTAKSRIRLAMDKLRRAHAETEAVE